MSLYVKGLPEHTRIVKPEKKIHDFWKESNYKVLITNSASWLPALGNKTFWEQ